MDIFNIYDEHDNLSFRYFVNNKKTGCFADEYEVKYKPFSNVMNADVSLDESNVIEFSNLKLFHTYGLITKRLRNPVLLHSIPKSKLMFKQCIWSSELWRNCKIYEFYNAEDNRISRIRYYLE